MIDYIGMRKSEYPKEVKTLGEKVRKRRMDLRLSLLEVSNKADITEGYLSRIEANKQIPLPSVAEKIAYVLNDNPVDYTSFCLAKYMKYVPKDLSVKKLSKPHKRILAGMIEKFKNIDVEFSSFSKEDREKLKKSWGKSIEEVSEIIKE